MSIEIYIAVRKYEGKDLDLVQKSVFKEMAMHASDNGRDVLPSLTTLMKYMSCSERTLQRVIKYLIENNFIVLDIPHNDPRSRYGTNEYVINLEKLGLSVNDLRARKKSPIRLSPGTVDKFEGGSHTDTPRVVTVTTGGSHTDTQYTYINHFINHMDHNGLKNDVVDKAVRYGDLKNFDEILNRLPPESRRICESIRELKTNKKLISRWLHLMGPQALEMVYRDVMQVHREKPSQIKNLGGYLRHMVEGYINNQQGAANS